jgi:hypothetical protein
MYNIRNLATQWFNTLPFAEKIKLIGSTKRWDSLTGLEIENIFYNEVVLKDWWDKLGYSEQGKLIEKHCGVLTDGDNIKDMYLKEHSKEESKGLNYKKLDKKFTEKLNTFDKESIEKWSEKQKPLLVNKNVEVDEGFNKWLENKKHQYFENKEECYQDILSSTTSAIDQYLKSPYQAQKGVLESAVKCNEMFLEFCEQQPKVEDNSWDEVAKILSNTKYRLPLSKSDTAVYAVDITKAIEILKEHYPLIKK